MNTKGLLPTLLLTAAAVVPTRTHAHEVPESSMTPTPMIRSAALPDREVRALLDFWRTAGQILWFAKDAEFDARFRSRFLSDHEAAARGELQHWLATPDGALALVLLLDQFPRNAFRDTPRMYDTDALARRAADTAFAAHYDQQIPLELRQFLVLPFAHSEDLADQERAVALARQLRPEDLAHAEHHRDIVRRFGRFPHRNRILGRKTTPEEQEYLDNGGYKG